VTRVPVPGRPVLEQQAEREAMARPMGSKTCSTWMTNVRQIAGALGIPVSPDQWVELRSDDRYVYIEVWKQATVHRASCGHPANEDGECDCSCWPERAEIVQAAGP